MHQIILRGFWRRWLSVIVSCVIGAIICVFYFRQWHVKPVHKMKLAKFIWLDLNNVTRIKICRNSKQGPYLIADERGYTCSIADVYRNGCCNTGINSTVRYNCQSCQFNRCCKTYEHCVSCCLQPHKRKLLEKVLVHAHNSRNPLLHLVQDTFELCLHKCRTSSTSVLRENTYRDSVHKYCYGLDLPHKFQGAIGKTATL